MAQAKRATARKGHSPKHASYAKAQATVDSTHQSAENVVRLSTAAMRDFLSTGTGEAQKAQEKAMEFSREGAEQMAKSADIFTNMMYDGVSMTRDSVEAAVESSNIVANMCKEFGAEASSFFNDAFAEGMEISKDAVSCRTMTDFMELQNRLMKYMVDSCFNQSTRWSNMCFEFAQEAAEPLNERFARATEQVSKAFTA